MSLTWTRQPETPPAPPAQRPASRSELVVERAPLPTLRDAWLQLEHVVESLFPVQTWDYQSAWWRHFRRRREGRTYVVRQPDGTPVAIVPLYIEERAFRLGTARVLAPVGHGEAIAPGRVDAVVAAGRLAEVTRALAPTLLRDPGWDFADWPDVPEGGALERIARAMIGEGRVELRSELRTAGPRLPLPETFESFIADIPDETRRKVLTLRAKITEEIGARWSSAGSELEIDSALRIAEELGCGEEGGVPSARPSAPDGIAAFRRELIRRGVPRGRVVLRVLFGRGQPLAALCGTILGGAFHAERTGFAKHVPAGVERAELARYLTLDTMERAVAARLDAVDFAAADDGWDLAWCENAPPVATLQVLRRGFAQRMAWFRAGLSESPRHVLRFVVGRERFDELESAWRQIKSSVVPTSD